MHGSKLERCLAVRGSADFYAFFPCEEAAFATLMIKDRDSALVVQVTALEVALRQTQDLIEVRAPNAVPTVVTSALASLVVAHAMFATVVVWAGQLFAGLAPVSRLAGADLVFAGTKDAAISAKFFLAADAGPHLVAMALVVEAFAAAVAIVGALLDLAVLATPALVALAHRLSVRVASAGAVRSFARSIAQAFLAVLAVPTDVANAATVDAGAILHAFFGALVNGGAVLAGPPMVARATFFLLGVEGGGVFLGVAVAMWQAILRAKLFLAVVAGPEAVALALEVHTFAVAVAVLLASFLSAGSTSPGPFALTGRFFGHSVKDALAVLTTFGVAHGDGAVFTSPASLAEAAKFLCEGETSTGLVVALAVSGALVWTNFGVALRPSPAGFAEALEVLAVAVAVTVVGAAHRGAVEADKRAFARAHVSTSLDVLGALAFVLAGWCAQRLGTVLATPAFFAEAACELGVIVGVLVFRAVAAPVVGARVGANLDLTVLTLEARLALALLVEALAVARAVLGADSVETFQARKAGLAATLGDTVSVASA